MIKLGTTTIAKAMVGSLAVKKIMLGAQLVWQNFVLVTEDLNYSSKTEGINVIQHEWTFASVRATQIIATSNGNGYDGADFTVYVRENGSWVQIYFNGDVNTASFTIDFDKTITGIKIVWAGGAYITRTITGKITKYYKAQ